MHTYIHMSLQGVCLSSRGFVRGLFLWKVLFRGVVRSLSVRTLPLQLNITFNIRFHMFQRNFKKCDVTCPWTPPPLTNCHTFSAPSPFERDVLYIMVA